MSPKWLKKFNLARFRRGWLEAENIAFAKVVNNFRLGNVLKKIYSFNIWIKIK